MELKILFTILTLSVICVVPYGEARPGFSIKQVRRNLNTIWKDFDGKRRKKKMRIREREITTLYDTEVFSNCRAVRLKPGHNCRNLAYQNGAVYGTDESLMGDQGVFQIETYGPGLIRLKYVENGLYLKMNQNGRINITNDKSNTETLFRHVMEEKTFLYTFASEKYYMVDKTKKNETGMEQKFDLLIGIKMKRNGRCKVKNAKNTTPDERTNQFAFDERGLEQNKYCKKN